MKPSNSNSKLTQYDQYRNRAKSDLNCSGLLSGLNELDIQMRQYQQKREMKGSQSQLQLNLPLGKGSAEKTPSNKQRIVGKYSESKTQRLNNSQLTTIAQYNPKSKQSKPSNIMTNSAVSIQTPKGKSQGIGPKVLFSKTVNAHSKEKQSKKEKHAAVKVRAKQLQQQMLQLFSSEPYKKNMVNRQFTALFKLLD